MMSKSIFAVRLLFDLYCIHHDDKSDKITLFMMLAQMKTIAQEILIEGVLLSESYRSKMV